MTQPYPFTHTADTWHAKASAATRLRSSRLRGDRHLISSKPVLDREDEAPKDSRITSVSPTIPTKSARSAGMGFC